MQDFFYRYKTAAYTVVSMCIIISLFTLLPHILETHYIYSSQSANAEQATTTAVSPSPAPVTSHVPTPNPTKGVYMTSWTASSQALRSNVVAIAQTTEINSVVIDIKDYSGKIVFPIDDNPALKAYGSEEVRVKDMRDFIDSLHKKGIYVIGRVAVFQDKYFVTRRPDLAVKNKAGTAVWKDHKGISWIDPGSREYWDYIVMLANEAHTIGFDEINFDYIRFPSDGNMTDISYPESSTTPKAEVLRQFFSYLHDKLSGSGLVMSADLFGMVTTASDDMGIGQVLENALPYFDYIDPMVYPSHYPATFMGFKEPEAHPYDVVHYAMQSAVTRARALASSTGESMDVYQGKLRPWLQDFGLRQTYGPAEVKAQIQATYDDGLSSWLLWSASNKYTVGALEKTVE